MERRPLVAEVLVWSTRRIAEPVVEREDRREVVLLLGDVVEVRFPVEST
jgi:hypothetical protein